MESIEERAGRWLRRIDRAERLITFGAFVVLIAVLFADVLSRELTGAGIIWARQVGVYANLFLTMVGLGVASADGAHLRPRFADSWLPASWGKGLERGREVVMAGFCLGFAALALAAVAETYTLAERTAVPRWLVWPFQAVIPAVFLVAGVRHGLYSLYPRLAPCQPSAAMAKADPVMSGRPVAP